MRDFLTVIAILLILVLSAALAVPYFVDWEARRAEVDRVLGEALGLPVTTGGAIALRLLPTPQIVLTDVSLGHSAGARFAARRVSVEVAPMPLLKGEVRVIEASLEAPVLTVRAGDDGALALPRPGAVSAANVEIAIERLGISGGTIRIENAAGSEIARITDIDTQVVAASLAGPWRIEGSAGGVPLRLSTGVREENGDMRVKGAAGRIDAGGLADVDGVLHLAEGPGGRLLPGITGTLRYSESLAGAGEPRQWSLSAGISGDSRRVAARDITLDLMHGEAIKDLALAGTATLDLGGRPSLQASLSGRRVDVDVLRDRIAEGGLDGHGAAMLARLPVRLGLTLDALAMGGEEFGPLTLDARRDGAVLAVSQLDLGLPGNSRITARGEGLYPGATGGAAGTGTVSFESGQPLRLARALTRIGAPQAMAEALARLPQLSAGADIAVEPTGVTARGIHLTAGEARLGGELRFTPAEGPGGRPRYDAEVTASGIDIDLLPNLDGLRAIAAGADVGLSIDARELFLGDLGRQTLGRLSALVEAGPEAIVVEYLDASGFGGAHIEAQGRLDRAGGRLGATIEAERPQALATLVSRFLPPRAGAIVARAGAAAGPLRLTFEAGRIDAGAPLAVKATGTAGQTAVDVALSLPPATLPGAELNVTLAAADGAHLLGQLGFETLPLPDREAGRFSVSARGPSLDQLVGSLALEAAGTRLAGKGAFSFAGDAPLFAGRVTMETGDAGRLAEVLARSLPTPDPLPLRLAADATLTATGLSLANVDAHAGGVPVRGRLSVDETGAVTGALAFDRLALTDVAALALGPLPQPPQGRPWSGERLMAAAPPVDGKLALSVGTLAVAPSFSLGDAAMTLSLHPAGLTVENLTGAIGGGRVDVGLAIRRDGTLASVSARGKLAGVPLAAVLGQPGVPGTLSGDFEAGTSGESPARLVASLAGGGTVTLSDVTVPGLDPGAVTRMVGKALSAETLRPDLPAVTSALAGEFDKGAWPVPRLTAPVSLSAGVLRFGPLALPEQAGVAEASIAGTLDLRSLTVDARANVVAASEPKGWTGAPPQASALWSGPVADPGRRLDAGGLANGLAAIGIVRELERIEAFEADARERAAHNRRFRAEREQRARELQRQAAEEARRREDEARRQQELQRQDDQRRLEELLREEERRSLEQRAPQQPRPPAPPAPPPVSPQPSQSGGGQRSIQLPTLNPLPEFRPEGDPQQPTGALPAPQRPPPGGPLDIRPPAR